MKFNDTLTVGMLKEALNKVSDDTKVFSQWDKDNLCIGVKRVEYRDNPVFMNQFNVVIEALDIIEADGFNLVTDEEVE